MSAIDTDALKKRFARALYVIWWTDHMQDPSASYDHPLNEDAREACESAADALLPVVAEEVRKAKAEALRGAASDIEASDHHLPGMTVRDVCRGLRFRADDMEIGGSDERRR